MDLQRLLKALSFVVLQGLLALVAERVKTGEKRLRRFRKPRRLLWTTPFRGNRVEIRVSIDLQGY